MARKVQITKDIILQAALDMLIRDGYSSINIKTLAQEIGCSTQPIVWHFDNMEGLRTALAEYAKEYANQCMYVARESAEDVFEQAGREYIRIAVEKPNLFRFLYLSGSQERSEGFQTIMSGERGQEIILNLSKQSGISKERIERYIRNTVIYTHGVATLVATNMIHATEDEMLEMINQASDAFIKKEENE